MFKRKLYLILLLAIFGCENSEEVIEKQNEKIASPPSISDKTISKMIQIDDVQLAELDLEFFEVKPENENIILEAPGKVLPAPDYFSIVSTPINGIVKKIYKHEGDFVKKGDVLLEIESPEYGKMIADYIRSEANYNYVKNREERIKILVEKKISAKMELEKITSELIEYNAELRAAKSLLKAIGITDSEIENMNVEKEINPYLKIKSPINGQINDHLIDLGKAVVAYEKIMNIINSEQVLVYGYFSPDDAKFLKVGDSVYISVREDDKRYSGSVIKSLSPSLDDESRSIVSVIKISTLNGFPKTGESVKVTALASELKKVIKIPSTALIYDGNQSVVFVKKSKNIFETREVVIDKLSGSTIHIETGIKPGEIIVKRKLFNLKALTRFEEFAE